MSRAGFLQHQLFLSLVLTLISIGAAAQFRNTNPVPGAPVTLQNAPQRDTSKKTNSSDWKDEQTRIYFRKMYSRKILFPDTGIRHFHRRPFSQTWHRDLGNLGSPSRSLLFRPEFRTGPTLGYHTFDVYRFDPDSLNFYNTTRPYTAFSYNLGSKAEQVAEILHTQNVQPALNFAVAYRKLTSPGHYRVQRNNHDQGFVTSNYLSDNQQYRLNTSFAYNKFQHDENGGIIADTFLSNDNFDDRATIPVRFQNDGYSIRRSSVTTMQRDASIVLLHSYTWGVRDTIYSPDSTQITPKLTPKFSISHRLQVHTEKYQFKDKAPDSLRYTQFFQTDFTEGDSLLMEQKWFYTDNLLLLNGFIGPLERQFQFSAGIGNRFDRFRTDYVTGGERNDVLSNYLAGEVRKEALSPGEWFYEARGRFFLTGEAAGNLRLQGLIGKNFGDRFGDIAAGIQQSINNAPYNYQRYKTRFYERSEDYGKESITELFVTFNSPRIISGGLRNYLIANYIYLDGNEEFAQQSSAFNLTQLWVSREFTLRRWHLYNELVYQQKTAEAPLNLPALMGRHQLSFENYVFGRALKIATGVDLRWHTVYTPSGYSPFFNRFFYQEAYNAANAPEVSVFFNFKVKNFRAFLMFDQLQNFIARNPVSAPGYPLQDFMIRFGFNWVMIN